jgi:hypothetical protein
MTDKKFELKEGEGTLWTNDCEILGRGKMLLNGRDVIVSLVKSKDKEGNPKHELMVSAGLIYFNVPEEKRKENSPDFSGKVNLFKNWVRVSIWDNIGNTGRRYFNIKSRPAEDEEVPF